MTDWSHVKDRRVLTALAIRVIAEALLEAAIGLTLVALSYRLIALDPPRGGR